MKKMIGFLAITILSNNTFSQDNLQLVTDRDNQTTNGLRVTAAAKLTGGPAVELYYGYNAGNLAAYDRNASAFKPLFIQAQTTSFPNGNVGIGTTSPAYKLDVNGYIRSFGQIHATSSSAALGFTDRSNDSKIWQWFADDNKANLYNTTYGGNVMSVSEAGNVNIQTSLSAGDILNINNDQQALAFGVNNNAGGAYIYVNTNHALRIGTNNSEKMRVTAEGNVAIGTVSPGSYKLAVEGTIGARKIKVTQEIWPDYVFDSSYQLHPLHQLEKFIQENKHLPEVPSAADVKKDGLDLGDNQAVLLKKIEELTLYIIQQNKQIDQQNKKIEHMGKELEAVKAIQLNSGQR